MESARKRDEARETSATVPKTETIVSPAVEASQPALSLSEAVQAASEMEPAPSNNAVFKPQIDEVLVCSAQGDILYEWQCGDANGRISFLEFLSQKARHLGQGLPLGDFERLEVHDSKARVIAQIQTDRAMLVRSSKTVPGGAAR